MKELIRQYYSNVRAFSSAPTVEMMFGFELKGGLLNCEIYSPGVVDAASKASFVYMLAEFHSIHELSPAS